MSQNCSVLGEGAKAGIYPASAIDAKMDDCGHTAKRRGTFALVSRRKCSKVQTLTCAFLLNPAQNHSRLDTFIIVHRP
jgi:hypothetical protein